MHADFEFALVAFCAVTGFIYLLDVIWWKRARADAVPMPKLVEFARSFFPVVFAVMFLRSFLVEPFRIPSGSMLPTLMSGDFILVNKFSYGVRLPVIHHKIIPMSTPQRGDVMVFRWPPDPSKDFIKRVIGLPGDHIVYRNRQLFINGSPVNYEPIGEFTDVRAPEVYGALQLTEQLPDSPHSVLHMDIRLPRDADVVVPKGHYFVMGDNRDGSDDSRRWGFVPDANLVGRAFFVWMSWDSFRHRPSFDRIGTIIR